MEEKKDGKHLSLTTFSIVDRFVLYLKDKEIANWSGSLPIIIARKGRETSD